MICRTRRSAAALAVAAILPTVASLAAHDPAPLSPTVPLEERALAERGLLLVRLDPKLRARPGACDALSAPDLAVTVDGVAAKVTAVERVPRPERHWLLLDVSESALGRRQEAMRGAREYIRRVMTPGLDVAAVLTVDDDTILVGGPSTDPSALEASVAHVPAGRGSALRDGLATVLRQVEGDRHEHLILYWTDGQDTQSTTTHDELLAAVARTRNATVFPLAIMPTLVPSSAQGPIGSFLFDVAKRSGGEVFASTDPRFIERVRGWIARRFTVAFIPPESAGRGELRVQLPGRKCEATILVDPLALPRGIAGEAPAAPRSWVRIHARQRKNDDPACAADPTASPWEWPLRSAGDRLAGCVLDAVEAAGPISDMRLAARDVRLAAPSVADLPHELVDAIPSLLAEAGGDGGARSPLIVDGGAFLAARARIAASLFAARQEYRDYALGRLARLADGDLRAIERDFRGAFPELDDAKIAAISRASRAGRRAEDAAGTPTDADLARVLAAWLGDLPALELFRAWEKRLVDARLAGRGDPDAVAHWTRLRTLLGQPGELRVAAPLVAIHDAQRDLVGFWRVVRPRSPDEESVPDRPRALDVLEDALRRKEVRERLAGATYHAARIDYAPFHPARITLTLEAPGRSPVVLER